MAFRTARKVCQQASTSSAARIESFGFSGAGFLACYHMGASKCLLEHGYLNFDLQKDDNDNDKRPILTGVSGGAIVAAAIASGVDPEDGMVTALAIAARTRQEGLLDALQPGFSLVDHVAEPMLQDIVNAVNGDMELLLRRIDGGSKLQIGLTNRHVVPYFKNPKAYCYVDQYRDAEDIAAACIMSSYVPGATGLWSGSSETLARASSRLREMADLGFIKKRIHTTGETTTVTLPSKNKQQLSLLIGNKRRGDNFPSFLDGGLCNTFPVIDHNTVVVTPIAGKFKPNRSVCPAPNYSPDDDNNRSDGDNDDPGTSVDDEGRNLLRLSNRVSVYATRQNAMTFRRMFLSSDATALQRRYSQGYDDAKRFLVQHGLDKVNKVNSSGFAATTNSNKDTTATTSINPSI